MFATDLNTYYFLAPALCNYTYTVTWGIKFTVVNGDTVWPGGNTPLSPPFNVWYVTPGFATACQIAFE